jgi:hypothetical protein
MTTGANVIKLLFTPDKEAREFVLGKPFQPILILANNAASYLSDTPFKALHLLRSKVGSNKQM